MIVPGHISRDASIKIRENLSRVQERIAWAARSVGRNPQDIRLVVVTKGHPVETARDVITAGATCLGENYVAEAIPKIEAISGYPDIEWHMIGHVQSRKAHQVCAYFNRVHSLDSLKLARRLDQGMQELQASRLGQGRRLPVLLECNMSGEESKFGYPAWQVEAWPKILEEIGEIARLPNLVVRGLMTMAPYTTEAEETRPYFQRLRRLQDYLARELPFVNFDELSMGMSADYEIAIQEGATWVRIGTAILGPRP